MSPANSHFVLADSMLRQHHDHTRTTEHNCIAERDQNLAHSAEPIHLFIQFSLSLPQRIPCTVERAGTPGWKPFIKRCIAPDLGSTQPHVATHSRRVVEGANSCRIP